MRVGGNEPAGDRRPRWMAVTRCCFARGAACTESGVSVRSTHFPLLSVLPPKSPPRALEGKSSFARVSNVRRRTLPATKCKQCWYAEKRRCCGYLSHTRHSPAPLRVRFSLPLSSLRQSGRCFYRAGIPPLGTHRNRGGWAERWLQEWGGMLRGRRRNTRRFVARILMGRCFERRR